MYRAFMEISLEFTGSHLWFADGKGVVPVHKKHLINPTNLTHPTPTHTPHGLENTHQASGASIASGCMVCVKICWVNSMLSGREGRGHR